MYAIPNPLTAANNFLNAAKACLKGNQEHITGALNIPRRFLGGCAFKKVLTLPDVDKGSTNPLATRERVLTRWIETELGYENKGLIAEHMQTLRTATEDRLGISALVPRKGRHDFETLLKEAQAQAAFDCGPVAFFFHYNFQPAELYIVHLHADDRALKARNKTLEILDSNRL